MTKLNAKNVLLSPTFNMNPLNHMSNEKVKTYITDIFERTP